MWIILRFESLGESFRLVSSSLVSLLLLIEAVGVFENISSSEIAVASFLQQISFYSISRLARRGFTVGELSIMTTAGNALCLEFWRLTRARVSPFLLSSFRNLRLMKVAVVIQSRNADDSCKLSSANSVARSAVGPYSWGVSFRIPAFAVTRSQSKYCWEAFPSTQGTYRIFLPLWMLMICLTVAYGTRSSTKTTLSRNILFIIRHRLLPPRRLGELDARHNPSRNLPPSTVDLGIRIHLLRRRINRR